MWKGFPYVVLFATAVAGQNVDSQGSHFTTETSTAEAFLREQMQALNQGDTEVDWLKFKQPEGFAVALDIASCESAINQNPQSVFAFIRYDAWAKTEPAFKSDEDASKRPQLNGCSCTEILSLFSFAREKTPHMLNHLDAVYTVICGNGYTKSEEKQAVLIDFFLREATTEVTVCFFEGVPLLLRLYLTTMALDDQYWSLAQIKYQIQTERDFVLQKVKTVTNKERSKGVSEENLAPLAEITVARTVLKANLIMHMIGLGLKMTELPKLWASGDTNVMTPLVQVMILEVLFGNAEAKRMASADLTTLLNIINNLSTLITTDYLIRDEQPTKSDFAVPTNLIVEIFDWSSKKTEWDIKMVETAVHEMCRASLKMLSEAQSRAKTGTGTAAPKAEESEQKGSNATPKTDESVHKDSNESVKGLDYFVQLFQKFDKAALEKFVEDNNATGLDVIEVPDKYLPGEMTMRCHEGPPTAMFMAIAYN